MSKPFAVIIEDDSTLNEIMTITLGDNFQTESFLDGGLALERLERVVPHLIILDLNLPTVSGRDILGKIRSDSRFVNTRIILTTANERIAELLTDQVDITLLKPISPIQLRELAARLFRIR